MAQSSDVFTSDGTTLLMTSICSFLGLLGGLGGGLLVGLANFTGIYFTASGISIWTQLPVILIGGIGGLVGTVAESYLGAIGRKQDHPDQVGTLP